jgi:hypothetical protein
MTFGESAVFGHGTHLLQTSNALREAQYSGVGYKDATYLSHFSIANKLCGAVQRMISEYMQSLDVRSASTNMPVRTVR